MANFSDVKVKLNFVLSLICVWPNENSLGRVRTLMSILSVYVLMVFIKNVVNPEKESIENAFILSNGNLIVIIFWITTFVRRETSSKFFDFILNDSTHIKSEFDAEVSTQAAKEVIRVCKWYTIVLPAATILRFFLPIFKLVMNLGTDKKVTYPPAMGVPVEYFGEIPTFIIETSMRLIMLTTLVGVCILYVISSLHICSQFKILANDIENFPMTEKGLEVYITRHQELLEMSQSFKKIFAPSFFSNVSMS